MRNKLFAISISRHSCISLSIIRLPVPISILNGSHVWAYIYSLSYSYLLTAVSRETSPSSHAGSVYDRIPSSGYGRQVAPVSAGYQGIGNSATMGRRTGIRRSSVSGLQKSRNSSRDTSPNSVTGISPCHLAQYGTEQPRRSSTSTGNYQRNRSIHPDYFIFSPTYCKH